MSLWGPLFKSSQQYFWLLKLWIDVRIETSKSVPQESDENLGKLGHVG